MDLNNAGLVFEGFESVDYHYYTQVKRDFTELLKILLRHCNIMISNVI